MWEYVALLLHSVVTKSLCKRCMNLSHPGLWYTFMSNVSHITFSLSQQSLTEDKRKFKNGLRVVYGALYKSHIGRSLVGWLFFFFQRSLIIWFVWFCLAAADDCLAFFPYCQQSRKNNIYYMVVSSFCFLIPLSWPSSGHRVLHITLCWIGSPCSHCL